MDSDIRCTDTGRRREGLIPVRALIRIGHPKLICRYLFPKALVDPAAAATGIVHEDSLRPGLHNLFLARNDSLINGFEAHLLLANLGNLGLAATH